MIQITKAKIEQITVSKEKDSVVKITGTYHLISEKGVTVAKQEFNTYGGLLFEFDKSVGKNFLEDIESEIEMTLGIQDAVKKGLDAK